MTDPNPTPPLDLAALTVIAKSATPGPWAWRGNTDTQQLRLTAWAKGIGECTVMDFERWGMQSAAPRFVDADHFMVSGKGLAVYQVARNQGLPDGTPRDHPKVYRADVVDINHPDARHMAAFDPPTVLALIARAEAAEAKIAAVRELHAAKHGEKPVYASDDWHAEREPVEWVSYAVCTGCSASYPCPTIAALDTHTPEMETP